MSGENQSKREAGTGAEPAGGVLFSYGFRPFFLMAGLFSVLTAAVWLAVYAGVLAPVSAYPPSLWHGHEMLFGYTAAAAAGFFLTAVPNWTGGPRVQGAPLAGLAALWLAGRLTFWAMPMVPAWLVAIIDVAFLPALAAAIMPALKGGSRRNLVFPAVLGVLIATNVMFHLEALEITATGFPALSVAVDTFALFIAIIGGRVTPAFTGNALRMAAARAGQPPPQITAMPWLNEAAIVSVALVVVVDAVADGSPVAGWVALAAAALNGARMAGWQTAKVLRTPILWVLHLGYGWLVLGLAVKGLAAVSGALPPSIALHGITIGAIGTMTLALMSRAALGHTGRALAAPRAMAAAYGLPSLAAVIRIAMAVATPALYTLSVVLSGLVWLLAFAIFVWLFWPVLTGPRVDRQPG